MLSPFLGNFFRVRKTVHLQHVSEYSSFHFWLVTSFSLRHSPFLHSSRAWILNLLYSEDLKEESCADHLYFLEKTTYAMNFKVFHLLVEFANFANPQIITKNEIIIIYKMLSPRCAIILQFTFFGSFHNLINV